MKMMLRASTVSKRKLGRDAGAPHKRAKSTSKAPAVQQGPKKRRTVGKIDKANTSPRSGSLSKVMRSYKGMDDFHIPLFAAVKTFTQAQTVLYPGCHRHVMASLVFSDVTYVDNYQGIAQEFNDPAVLEWIRLNKTYPEPSKLQFLLKDFTQPLPVAEESVDLMVSACAGIVSASCGKYVRVGGHFLVSDAHFDARMTWLDKRFRLCAVYDMETQVLHSSPEQLEGHFKTIPGMCSISRQQVDESMETPKARRKFKLAKEAMFYLFARVESA
jgi:hypothetical protein